MGSDNSKTTEPGFSRREFLLMTGTGAPMISLMVGAGSETTYAASKTKMESANGKFTPIDMTPYFNASAREFGPRDGAAALGGGSAHDHLIRVPGGKRDLQGIPFSLGLEGADSKSWLVLSTQPRTWATKHVEVRLQHEAHFLCLASFCDFDENETPPPGKNVFENVGQHLGDITVIYEDNGTHVLPIRRRFETNAVAVHWGHQSFASLPPGKWRALKLTDPLREATEWGTLQTVVSRGNPGEPGSGLLWVCALENSEPSRSIRALRFEAAGDDPWVVCGLTLYHCPEYPLRFEGLALYRITLPEAEAEDRQRWQVDVDLGYVGRTFALPEFQPDAWLSSPAAGIGEATKLSPGTREFYVEVIANARATLTLHDSKTGQRYEFELAKALPLSEAGTPEAGGRIELVERDRTWVHCQVLDPETKNPTAVRLAFRSKEGRYIPPYGHRTEINDSFFQDYGADVKLMDTSFAYVDGTFQVELPLGEVYLEMTKGFEYQAVRRKIEIQHGQRELTLEIPRLANLRSQGWVTGDTHVHFLPPVTALLEAQAEGLNLINLLAAQLGDLFTNVGDLPHGPVVSSDRETMIWVGSENRQHILGHIGLLGVHGSPVFPMSADGPGEAYLGDPLWRSMAEWADACHQREGLVVSPHFPYPNGEIAADIVLGKIDAVEIWPRSFYPHDVYESHYTPLEQFTCLRYLDWYHYLNCGYRLPAVGGTDKMGAYMPAGTNRVYAYLGQKEFSFQNWAQAVRNGNTFVTSGPLLMFLADGHSPGEQITLGVGGGTIEVSVEVQSFVPFHHVDVIYNGRVVASREEHGGTRALHLTEKVKVPGPGWLAARCASQWGPVTNWGFKIAAHTSPVYVSIPGQDLFSAEAATYFLQLIDGARTYVETLAIRPDPERFAKVQKVFTDARAELHHRLHQHGIPH